MTNSPFDPIYSYEFTVPEDALDENGHVNNVRYLQWMQEAAIRHCESIGGIPPTQALGATWVVRSHAIEYLRPAFAGDRIELRTWVVNIRRVRSLRRYRFIHLADGKLLVKGETEWVFVGAKTGAPRLLPDEARTRFLEGNGFLCIRDGNGFVETERICPTGNLNLLPTNTTIFTTGETIMPSSSMILKIIATFCACSVNTWCQTRWKSSHID